MHDKVRNILVRDIVMRHSLYLHVVNLQLFQLDVVHQKKAVELFFHPSNKKQELYHLTTENLQ